MQTQEATERISEFIVGNFLFGDQTRTPAADQSLLASGIVDSTGILELIEYLEEEFQLSVGEDETTPDNLDSINSLTAFVVRKTAA